MENIKYFGTTPSGEDVYCICLQNEKASCEVISYGASLKNLLIPDRNGNPIDVVLGYDTLEQYLADKVYMGATVGRVANRIAIGSFTLNGETYTLPINNGKNHHHGGPCGFTHKVWKIESVTQTSVTLSHVSPDGDQGYPGTMKATAEYTLRDNSLIVRHTAVSDKDTLCSFTNHSYFNLAGHNTGNAMGQNIQIHSQEYTPSNAEGLPLGFAASVEGTPLDLRTMIPIETNMDDPMILEAKGYDHNYVVKGNIGTLRPAAVANCPKTGIQMQVDTTMPGMHFYTSIYVREGLPGKNGATYGPQHAFCLETQYYPDAIHHENFPAPILKAGDTYDHATVFTFSQF